MRIEDHNAVYVLNRFDGDGGRVKFVDRDGDSHDPFRQDRSVLVLSVPNSLELRGGGRRRPGFDVQDVVRQLLDTVATAMEGKPDEH